MYRRRVLSYVFRNGKQQQGNNCTHVPLTDGTSLLSYSLAMKVFLVSTIAALAAATAHDLDAQTKAIVDKMTLSQLLAQMNQLDINSLTTDFGNGSVAIQFDLVAKYANMSIGSYLNYPFGARVGTKYNMNASEMRSNIQAIQALHMNATGIPILFGIDSVHGANYVHNATLFPHAINTGATFNTSYAAQAGLYTGRDSKAAGFPWVFGPMLEPVRHKHWSRVYESFNEDPGTVAIMAKAYIQGLQSQQVAACPKHMIAYSDPKDGNDRSNVDLSSYELQNYFVPQFKAAFDGGALSVMGSYIALNGVPVVANSLTSKAMLRKDLGFQGPLVTDYGEIYLLHTDHKVVESDLDAVDLCMNATSYDMSMVPWDTSFITLGLQLVNQSRLTIDRIKESVSRLVKLKLQLDLFNQPTPGADLVALVGDQASQSAALAAARESLVLLKNTNQLLPLTPNATNTSVLLTGPSIDNLGYLCGGWTMYWQGVDKNDVFPRGTTIRQAMQRASPLAMYLPGLTINGNFTDARGSVIDAIDNATLAAAANASVTVIALGEPTYAEDKGNPYPQALPAGFLDFVTQVKATGTKIVLVLVEGRPRTLNGLAELADAIVWAGLPCEAGGQAIADVLFGKVNPSGKLPYTYPKTDEFMNLKTPYYLRNATHCFKNGTNLCPAEWQYGEGLSYTTFDYSSVKLSTTAVTPANPTVMASVTVTNTGAVAGLESVLLFLTPPARRDAESKLLKKFTKIHLAPNEAKVVSFELTPDDWGFVSAALGQGLNKSAPSGLYTLAWKASTDCAASPSNPLCVGFKWDNLSSVAVSKLSTSVAAMPLATSMLAWMFAVVVVVGLSM
ncbi:Aste57867_17232 [Aphanomyces stellatus]|uniref:beta-glucosidase n=1 Tax=Aphanomyces stellatus TaxID=120398 RepID=A0A485LAW6_9STRA|nr:hypothetical protein As57867_017173 [Aphanomyces stellatus]VFT93988.1 Aste57867_17232 [Aphanomyces stellatus]